MTLPKKTNKPITALDLFNTIIFLAVGFIIMAVVENVPEVLNVPHSGFLVLGGLGLSIFGVIRFLIKYFRQPINRDVKE